MRTLSQWTLHGGWVDVQTLIKLTLYYIKKFRAYAKVWPSVQIRQFYSWVAWPNELYILQIIKRLPHYQKRGVARSVPTKDPVFWDSVCDVVLSNIDEWNNVILVSHKFNMKRMICLSVERVSLIRTVWDIRIRNTSSALRLLKIYINHNNK